MAIFKKKKLAAAAPPEEEESPEELEEDNDEEEEEEEPVKKKKIVMKAPETPQYKEIPICLSQAQINNIIIENNIMLKQIISEMD